MFWKLFDCRVACLGLFLVGRRTGGSRLNSRPGLEMLALDVFLSLGSYKLLSGLFSGSLHTSHPFLNGKECSEGFVKEKTKLFVFPGASSC